MGSAGTTTNDQLVSAEMNSDGQWELKMHAVDDPKPESYTFCVDKSRMVLKLSKFHL